MGNRVKEKLKSGEVVLGQMLLELFTPGMAHMLANCGSDFVLYDMEHGRCDLSLLAGMIVSAHSAGIVPLVRVPDLGAQPLSRVLDLGARGVMVPRVETAEQMREIVAQLKYAPQGRRGVALGVAHDNYQAGPPSYLQDANRDVLVIALLETARAYENLEAIIATPGSRCGLDGTLRPDDFVGDTGSIQPSDVSRLHAAAGGGQPATWSRARFPPF